MGLSFYKKKKKTQKKHTKKHKKNPRTSQKHTDNTAGGKEDNIIGK